MERLLVLRLEAVGCDAEAVLNGIPVARVGASTPTQVLPVHEFALAGANRISLVVEPSPAESPDDKVPRLSDGQAWAGLRLLLPRIGQVAHPASARTLAQLDWAPPQGELYETPLHVTDSVELPISFPRWRWLDAPVVEDPGALKLPALKLLQRLAVDLARGEPESFVSAARLRFEEVASAYQRNLADEVGRWRVQVRALAGAKPFKPLLPTADLLRLRPVADGRLLECLGSDGNPMLSGVAGDGRHWRWPIRLAHIEGHLHVLR